MGVGKNTSTTTNTSANPNAMAAYYNLLPQIQKVSQTPFAPYTGEFVAPVNQQQQTGISGVNANAYSALPYLQQAGGLLTSAGTPLTTSQINQYYSPYQQDVINATEQQFNNQNAIQQQQVLGNAAAQGALGGDRTAVAQSVLAGQQQTQEAPVIANLENQGYSQALQTAQQQFQQNPEAVAYGLGSTGTALENAGLTGATAQIGAGTLQQQTQQALDQALYNQFLQQQGFPFQELSWATGLETGLGGAMGGTSTTTPPAPNPISTYGGLGLAALGLFANRGGRIPRRGLATGGSPFGIIPYGGVPSYIPTAAAPTPLHMNTPGAKNQTQSPKDPFTPQAITGADSGMKSILGNVLPGSDSYGGGNMFSGDAYGGSAANPLPGLTAADYGGDISTDVTGGLFSGGMDLGAGLGADAAAGAAGAAGAADAGAGLADLLPLLALANRGGRIGKAYGGLVLPKRNRIQLKRGGVPVRAGLGLASFVKRRGFDDGGAATFGDRFQPASDLLIDPDDPSYAGLEAGTTQQAYKNLATEMPEGEPPASAYPAEFAGLSATTPVSQRMAPPQDSEGLGTTTLAFNDGRPVRRIDTPPAPEPAPAHDYSADIKRPQGINFGLGLISPEAKAGLLAAGLGMMASRSPYAGVGIGQGGLQGLQTYSGLKKQEQDVDLAVAKLNQQAKSEQDRIAQESKQLAETSRHNKATEAYQQQFKEFEETKPQTMFDQSSGQIRAYGRDKLGVWRWLDTGQPMIGPPGTAPNAPGAPMSGNQPNAQPSTGQPSQPQGGLMPAVFKSGDGFRLQTAQAIANGQTYNYSAGAPYIERGMDIPDPQPVSGRSAPAIQTAAEYFLQTGKLPPTSRGNSPVAIAQQTYANAVQNYGVALAASRGLTPEQTADMWRSAPGMLRFIMSPDGRATVSLGTAIRHLDLLQQLGTAWAANDNQTVNRVRALISREFGSDAATNLTTASQIVGPEIIKAIGVAGGGGEREREAASAWANPISSPAQLAGAIKTTQGLLAGQLEGKRRQAAAAGVDEGKFRNLVGDRPYEILTNINKGAEPATAPATTTAPVRVRQNGHVYERQPDGSYKAVE